MKQNVKKVGLALNKIRLGAISDYNFQRFWGWDKDI